MVGLILFIIYWFTFLQRRYDVNLFVLFLLATSCYQFAPVKIIELNPVVTKPYDWVSLIIVGHLIFRARHIQFKKYLTLPVRLYLAFLIFLGLYSLLVLHVETKVVLSVFRLHLFIISPILFTEYKFETIEGVIKWVCVFTVLASAVYITQAFVGKAILSSLQSDDITAKQANGGLSRFYNLPFYAVFALIYYARKVFDNFKPRYLLYAVIVLLAIIISFNRNTLIVAILSLIAVYYHNRKVKIVNVAFLVLLGWIITIPFSESNDGRLNQGFNDLKNFNTSMNLSHMFDYKPSEVSELSTTQFRALHFYERFSYVTGKGVFTSLTGVGLVNEQSSFKNKLDFSVGLVNEGTDEVVQIDTGDIVWSLLILQTGLIGIILFITVYISYIRYYLRYRAYTFSYLSAILITALLLTSFFGIDIISPPIVMFVSMLFVLTYKGVSVQEESNEPDYGMMPGNGQLIYDLNS